LRLRGRFARCRGSRGRCLGSLRARRQRGNTAGAIAVPPNGWPSGQVGHLPSERSRDHGSCGLGGSRRDGSSPAAFADQQFDGVALVGVQATELILDIDAGLTAQVKQILALDVQFARERVDTNFLFLQAQLLSRQILLRISAEMRLPWMVPAPHPVLLILTVWPILKRLAPHQPARNAHRRPFRGTGSCLFRWTSSILPQKAGSGQWKLLVSRRFSAGRVCRSGFPAGPSGWKA